MKSATVTAAKKMHATPLSRVTRCCKYRLGLARVPLTLRPYARELALSLVCSLLPRPRARRPRLRFAVAFIGDSPSAILPSCPEPLVSNLPVTHEGPSWSIQSPAHAQKLCPTRKSAAVGR